MTYKTYWLQIKLPNHDCSPYSPKWLTIYENDNINLIKVCKKDRSEKYGYAEKYRIIKIETTETVIDEEKEE